jgi:hypothetical protein
MSLLSRMFLGLSALRCSPLRTLFSTCVRGNLRTVTEMQPAKRRFLRIFYSLIWCCIGTCVLWDTRHRGGTCFAVLYLRSIEVSGAPFPRSYGGRFKNSGMECTIRGVEHTKTWDLPFPFLISHILRKKGIKGSSTDKPMTESPYFGRIQWNHSCPTCPKPHQSHNHSHSHSLWTFLR